MASQLRDRWLEFMCRSLRVVKKMKRETIVIKLTTCRRKFTTFGRRGKYLTVIGSRGALLHLKEKSPSCVGAYCNDDTVRQDPSRPQPTYKLTLYAYKMTRSKYPCQKWQETSIYLYIPLRISLVNLTRQRQKYQIF